MCFGRSTLVTNNDLQFRPDTDHHHHHHHQCNVVDVDVDNDVDNDNGNDAFDDARWRMRMMRRKSHDGPTTPVVVWNDTNTPVADQLRGKALAQVLAHALDKVVADNTMAGRKGDAKKFHSFHGHLPPSIAIQDYIMRIFQYAACSPECFVLSLIYIDRLIQRHRFVLDPFNVHRVAITSVVLAAKFFDDQYYNNAFYARIAGIPCAELNGLEVDFLFLVNFSLHVPSEVFVNYYNYFADHYVFSQALECLTQSRKQQLRHRVTRNPTQDNQLVYITHLIPATSN